MISMSFLVAKAKKERGGGLHILHYLINGTVVKNLLANAGDVGLIPGSERLPGEGNGNPLQYSCLENSMDRGDLQATVHRVTKNWT